VYFLFHLVYLSCARGKGRAIVVAWPSRLESEGSRRVLRMTAQTWNALLVLIGAFIREIINRQAGGTIGSAVSCADDIPFS
jgi:hypothetical protein